MSTWFVNTAYTSFFAREGEAVTWVDCTEVTVAIDIDTRDVLSAPSVEDLLQSGLALWPVGAAWGTPDGAAPSSDSVIAKLTRAMLDPFAALYARAWRLVEEAAPSTVVDSLEDWERDYGLPDPCVTVEQSEERRRQRLRSKVAGLASITPADFVRLAASLGYVVALEEPDAFRCGESECGIGGELSDTALEQQFVMHIKDAPSWNFEVGISEVGVDRLLDFDNDMLVCAVRRVAPAWTIPVFSVEPLPEPFLILDENGNWLTTETGLPIYGLG